VTLETLLLLQRCLLAQQLNVADPTFSAVARQVLVALDELAAEIAAAQSAPGPQQTVPAV
jgi:hypothetical protein